MAKDVDVGKKQRGKKPCGLYVAATVGLCR